MTALAARIASAGWPNGRVLARAPDKILTLPVALEADESAYGACISYERDASELVIAICMKSPLGFIRALLALDGRVRGMLLLSPALPTDAIFTLMSKAGATALASDRPDIHGALRPETLVAGLSPQRQSARRGAPTQWLMTTSGTTGLPKVVRHSLDSLSRSARPPRIGAPSPVWGLLYEPSRFAGLQVVLQALLGGGTLVAVDRDASLPQQISFLKMGGCTHLSATPTLWRKLLMSPEADDLPLRQITLGGEIADASVLRALATRYPSTRVTHIFASTETGVGFSVKDGLPGFPAHFLEEPQEGVALKVVDEMLWVRSFGSVGEQVAASHIVRDPEGYVRTGDRVRIDGDRVMFLGRESTTVNIGGAKVQLEEVEQVVNLHPDVAECRVVAQPSPIVGALLALTVAPKEQDSDPAAFRSEIKAWCKSRLPREAQPAFVKIAESIASTAASKVSRV